MSNAKENVKKLVLKLYMYIYILCIYKYIYTDIQYICVWKNLIATPYRYNIAW